MNARNEVSSPVCNRNLSRSSTRIGVANWSDGDLFARLEKLLENWRYTGTVTAKPLVLSWIAKNLPGLALKEVARAMYAFLVSGGVINQVPENRPEWNTFPFHYNIRMRLAGRFVYIEAVLLDDDPADPTILVVSMHDA